MSESSAYDDVLRALADGDCALVGTDTVVGLAAKPASEGERAIFRLKQRPASQRLPWLISDASLLNVFADDPHGWGKRLSCMLWPGALTLVLPATDEARMLAADSRQTVALRVPDDETCRRLLSDLETPLATTSANLHGLAPATCLADLPENMRSLPGASLLVDSSARPSLPSAIVDCCGPQPRVLREGAIPEQLILTVAVYGDTLGAHPSGDEPPRRPRGDTGMTSCA
ncbi:MAG: L-threonylcarbamoyladenylate synthase [Coriobacteriaceae bacterium]|nr:L-threonylcarbamoyladenylate synthase [Coriobacteriaceae bacterium]